MRTVIIFLAFTFFSVSIAFSQQKKSYKIIKTKNEWRKELTQIQFYVLRESGTERAFSSSINTNKATGIYACAACKTPLYKSEHKYNSFSGWPSFDRAIKKNIELDVDYEIGYARTELKCNIWVVI